MFRSTWKEACYKDFLVCFRGPLDGIWIGIGKQIFFWVLDSSSVDDIALESADWQFYKDLS